MSTDNHSSPVTTYGAEAMRLMGVYKVEPTPNAYGVWFAYVSGQNSELIATINTRLQANEPIDQAFMDTLESVLHAPNTELSNSALATGEQLSGKMDSLIELIASASGDTNKFGQSMQSVSAALNREISADDLGRVVDTVVAATRQMEKRSQQLEDRLTQSKQEVEELRTNLAQARNEAMTDQLTGIANRKAFDEVLLAQVALASQNGNPLCLAMGDIDFFKKFNDTFGHQAGDQVLRLVGRCLDGNVKGHDTPARYGGEEFAMILPNTQLDDAVTLANHIREIVQSRELVKKSTGENLGKVTMSLGVTQFALGDTPQTMIERADKALYRAKDEGRNRVIAANDQDAADTAASA